MINIFSNASTRRSHSLGGGGDTSGGGDGTSLLNWSNMIYEGSFRCPNDWTINSAELKSGGGGLWYNPANNSLFMRGRDERLDIIEMAIPETLTDGYSAATTSDIVSGTFLQGRRFETTDIPNFTLANGQKLGGTMLHDGKVYMQIYRYYDADVSTHDNVFYFDSTDISSANIDGLYAIGTGSSSKNASYASGYFGDVPVSKQTKLGGYTHFAGQNGLAITGRCSQGPVFIGFNPGDIGVTEPTEGGWYLYYEEQNKLGWGDDAIWNPMSRAWGGFIPDGTNCIIFLGVNAVAGSKGYVDIEYGPGTDFNDACNGSKGYHSVNGDYGGYFWAYDLDDLESAKNGTVSPYAITPYAHGEIDFPHSSCRHFLAGVGYDRTNKKVYTCDIGAHQASVYTTVPIFHCWSHN